MAVALDARFYRTLPALEEVDEVEADIAWFVYDLVPNPVQNVNVLTLDKTVYTKFEAALLAITHFEAGNEARFIQRISTKAEKARRAKDGDDLPERTLDPNL